MSLFQKTKKRGRPARNIKKENILKITRYSIFSTIGIIIASLLYTLWSFSSFLFIIPKSFDLLGMDEKKTYLITLHNDGELRPTLGFLTGFIFLEIEKGGLHMEFHDSYDIAAPENSEKILAPDIIEERFSNDPRYQGWVLRDSNFSPIHEINAKKILEFLPYDSRYKNKKIDGVFSIDLYALGQIIDAIGGVSFEDKALTSKNLFSVLENKAKNFDHHSEEEWLNRKSSLKPLANSILKTLAFSPLHWREFSQTVEKLGKEKHFLVFFQDEAIQKKIRDKKWDGNIHIPEKSFFMGHNIANLGGKKGDRYINKTFSSLFSVSAKGKISEKLSLQLQHTGTRNLHSDRYFAFVRVFREKGAVLQNFSGDFVNEPQKITDTNSKSLSPVDPTKYEEFQFFLAIDESSEKNFVLEFSYPERISTEAQNIVIFSQAGKNSALEKHSLIFQAQGDSSFEISGCDEEIALENISQCHITSSGDKNIVLEMQKDTRAPLLEESIIQQEGKIIRLQFSEEIQNIYPASVLIQEKVTGKKAEVINLEKEERAIILTLKNPLKKNHPFNTGEKNFYTVHIDDITDISGNTVAPFRMTIAPR